MGKKQTIQATYDKLRELYPDLDHSLKKRSVFSVKEEKTRYELNNLREYQSIDYRIDGVLILEGEKGSKCDHLLLVQLPENQWVQVFIELKGTRVCDAIVQLEEILQHSLFSPCPNKECRFARVVGKKFPSNNSDSKIEQARERFQKRYGCSLKSLKSNQSENFERDILRLLTE
nr:hypothetical protein [uncultured Porphyromonas sp.]